jgi:asparagine synthetase B (glutamine-hydrolysing)
MAGITAFVRFGEILPSGAELTGRMMNASVDLPGVKRVNLLNDGSPVALGGTYPAHFQRRGESAGEGGKTLLFYGELYNDLCGEDEAEYVLRRWTENPTAALALLNGPFVFFLYDAPTGELTVATDRLGRFPLFTGEVDGTRFFTTDLHAIFNAGIVVPELEEKSIASLLTIGFPLGEESMFRGVKRITGGSLWKVSRRGISSHTYWKPDASGGVTDINVLVDSLSTCVHRALRHAGEVAVTLSGGWDSRATCAIAASGSPPRTVTFGVPGSADVELARVVARTLGFPHLNLMPEEDFFTTFQSRAEDVVRHSGGHATIDLAFQHYMYDRLRGEHLFLLDSAGCEFRRGIRASRAARQATCTRDIALFLLGMYSGGIWNAARIGKEFYATYRRTTEEKLTALLDGSGAMSRGEQIDYFMSAELWSHGYAHGYPLQTHLVGCLMPFSDNEFLDLFLNSIPEIRWSHMLHRAVIHRYAPQLETIPISHGGVTVPYGDSPARDGPMLYHRLLSHAASRKGWTWLRSFDNSRPFRPYARWYGNELEHYVAEMLLDDSSPVRDYIDRKGISELLHLQKQNRGDYSHGVSLLLTLSHLLKYAKELRARKGS